MKLIQMPRHLGLASGGFTREPSATLWTDPSNQEVLDQLKNGQVTIRQAAEILGIEPALLAYQLSGKVCQESVYDGGAIMDYGSGMIAVPADLDIEDEYDGELEEHIISPDIEIDEDTTESSGREGKRKNVVKNSQPSAKYIKDSAHDSIHNEYEEDENGTAAPIMISGRSKKLTKDDARRAVC